MPKILRQPSPRHSPSPFSFFSSFSSRRLPRYPHPDPLPSAVPLIRLPQSPRSHPFRPKRFPHCQLTAYCPNPTIRPLRQECPSNHYRPDRTNPPHHRLPAEALKGFPPWHHQRHPLPVQDSHPLWPLLLPPP